MSFYTKSELQALGLKSFGKNVLVSSKVSIYNPGRIVIGDNTRVDDFTILSATDGSIVLGSHVHVASHCLLIGGGGIVVSDFCGISSFTSIYSANDDYSGQYLAGPMNDKDLTDIDRAQVTLEKYVVCGSHSVVLPGITLGQGSVLGACSLANRDLEAWHIYAGTPARKLRARKRDLIEKSKIMEERWEERVRGEWVSDRK